MAFIQYLAFDGTPLLLQDSYEVQMVDIEADSGGETEAGTLAVKNAEMFIDGYKAELVKDTSYYKERWKVSFTLKEFWG